MAILLKLKQFLKNNYEFLISFLLSCIILIAIPLVQIGLIYSYIWVPNKAPVDTERCSCSCFDTIFRGSFENQPVGYKHVYWNSTLRTLLIYSLYVVNIILWYKSIEYIVILFVRQQPVRWVYLLLVVINIFPNYYSWWSYFIYMNESMWTMFNHHLPFYITELVVTITCLHLISADNSLDSWKLLLIMGISAIHLIVGGLDQFFVQLIFKYESTMIAQVFRDLALVFPDLAHLFLPYLAYKYEIKRPAKWNGNLITRSQIIRTVLCVLVISFILRMI